MAISRGSVSKQVSRPPNKRRWSAKYKKSIDCKNPRGFSQKAHCAGRKKKAGRR